MSWIRARTFSPAAGKSAAVLIVFVLALAVASLLALRDRPASAEHPYDGVEARLSSSATTVLPLAGGGALFGLEAPTAGVVHFEKIASSDFDREDRRSNAAWIRSHFSRMITYAPFFDSRTRWYPGAWAYRDAYALYLGSSLAARHPSWILRDASGRPVYIPYGSPPSQYAADITNPAYRHYWIRQVKRTLAHGYRGVMVDDVNMWTDTGDVHDHHVVPISPVTRRPISDALWRSAMVRFMRELRAAIPSYEIVHNSVWYADGGQANRSTTSSAVRAQILAANAVVIERGVTDSGLQGGSGPWSVSNLLTYVDEVHTLGRSVILASGAQGRAAMEYNLAAYFLVSNGTDLVSGGGDSQTVRSFWPGWSTDLGAALGRRYAWNGLLRRDFQRGSVFLNPPGGAPVAIPGRTLAGASGAIVTLR